MTTIFARQAQRMALTMKKRGLITAYSVWRRQANAYGEPTGEETVWQVSGFLLSVSSMNDAYAGSAFSTAAEVAGDGRPMLMVPDVQTDIQVGDRVDADGSSYRVSRVENLYDVLLVISLTEGGASDVA